MGEGGNENKIKVLTIEAVNLCNLSTFMVPSQEGDLVRPSNKDIKK